LTISATIREFNRLDTEGSEKQFILLVNKGREGWNCRSLFGVGLFREPESNVFVLQATMRCLRAIGEPSERLAARAGRARVRKAMPANPATTRGSGKKKSQPIRVGISNHGG
jgi:hypothetical protein